MPQMKVYQNQAWALPGMKSNVADPDVFCHPTYRVAPGATVKIGGFFWATTAPAGADKEFQDQAFAAGTGTGAPAGFAGYEPLYPMAYDQNGTLVVPAGFAILGLEKSARYVASSTAPTVGQVAFATLTDGSVQFGDADATIAGAVETAWVVKNVISAQNISSGTETAEFMVEISNL